MNDQPPIGVIIIILVSALFGTGVLMVRRLFYAIIKELDEIK